jgi:predicted PurR-regulated permease PerM
MNTADTTAADRNFQKNAMASYVQIAGLTLLLIWCFRILGPFLNIVMWALIISVAIYPMHVSLSKKLGGREKTSATIFVLIGLAILLIPAINMADSSIGALHRAGEQLSSGAVSIPPPNASVAQWPLIGSTVFDVWSGAAVNLEATLNKFQPQLASLGQSALKFAGAAAFTVLTFVFSILVAGAFLVIGPAGYSTAKTLSSSLIGNRGPQLTDLSIETIRSVAKGVLGVAVIQSLLSAIGLVLVGVPAAGLWAALVLVLAIIQLPPLIVLGPIAVWVFSTMDATPATIFAVYAFIVSISDSFLKPMFLGRGMEIPMLVILLGAIGGAMLSGIIGLFVGAVVLALGYTILSFWTETDELNNPRQAAAESAE